MDKKERRRRLQKSRKSKETIIGMQTTRYVVEWHFSGTRRIEGHVPNSVMKEGDNAIQSWLWMNASHQEDDYSEFIPSIPELIEEE